MGDFRLNRRAVVEMALAERKRFVHGYFFLPATMPPAWHE